MRRKDREVTDFDKIWRLQDEIRSAVNGFLGETVWDLSYNARRCAIELELTIHIDNEAASELCSQMPLTADYDGEGLYGTRFVFYE